MISQRASAGESEVKNRLSNGPQRARGKRLYALISLDAEVGVTDLGCGSTLFRKVA